MNNIIIDGSKETACFNPLMEISDTTVPQALHDANVIVSLCTEGFSQETQDVFTASLLIVRFSKSIPISEKNFAKVLTFEYTKFKEDCIHDDGRKWKAMNTLIKVLLRGKLKSIRFKGLLKCLDD